MSFVSQKSLLDSALLTDGKRVGVTLDLVELYDATVSRSKSFPIFSLHSKGPFISST